MFKKVLDYFHSREKRAKQCIFPVLGRLFAPSRFGAGSHEVTEPLSLFGILEQGIGAGEPDFLC